MQKLKSFCFVQAEELPVDVFNLVQATFNEYVNCPQSYTEFVHKFRSHNVFCVITYNGSTAAGFTAGTVLDAGFIHCYYIAVQDQLRGRGYATAIAGRVRQMMLEHGIRHQTLFTMQPASITAIYRRAGFIVSSSAPLQEVER